MGKEFIGLTEEDLCDLMCGNPEPSVNIGEEYLLRDKTNNFRVKVVDTFWDNGVEYAEVSPTEFTSFTREIPITRLEEI